MKVIKPPQKIPNKLPKATVFLGGTIDMGYSNDWQTKLINDLNELDGIILNPRRDNWDSSWEQKSTNPNFLEQVNWELEGQERASIICYYFAGESKSPITLLELGLFKDKTPIVFCPENFYRYGNIDIVCDRYKMPHYTTYSEFLSGIKNALEKD